MEEDKNYFESPKQHEERQKQLFYEVARDIFLFDAEYETRIDKQEYRWVVTRWDGISQEEIVVLQYEKEKAGISIRFKAKIDNQKDLQLYRAIEASWIELTMKSVTPEVRSAVRGLVRKYVKEGIVAFLETLMLPSAYLLI
jgi:hypothetical protein